jgi:recombination protein RecA
LDVCLRGKYFDEISGNGGVPAGRVVRIDGESGGGKSLLAWHILSDCVRKGGMGLYFDIERALTEEFAGKIQIPEHGVIIIPHLKTIEKIFMASQVFVTKFAQLDQVPPHGVIVVDSVQSMMTEDMLADEEVIGGQNFGRKAKLMGEFLQKLLPYLDQYNITLVLVNQLRTNLKKQNIYDDDWMVPTANAQEFYSQMIIRVYKSSLVKVEKVVVGQTLRMVVKKSRYTGLGKEVKVDLLFNSGLQNEKSMFDALKAINLVSSAGSKGSKINVDGEEFCFKAENFKDLYRSNQKVQDWTIKQIESTYDNGSGWYQTDQDLEEKDISNGSRKQDLTGLIDIGIDIEERK